MSDEPPKDLRFPPERRKDNRRKWAGYPRGYLWEFRDGVWTITFEPEAKDDLCWRLSLHKGRVLIGTEHEKRFALVVRNYTDPADAMLDVQHQKTSIDTWDKDANAQIPHNDKDWEVIYD